MQEMKNSRGENMARICTSELHFLSFVFITISCSTQISAQPAVSGYIKSAFTYTTSDAGDESETSVSNARIKVSGGVNESTKYAILFDAVSDEILLDAYINHTIIENLSVKIGQFKTAFSTDNLISNTKVSFISRLYMEKNVSPAYRDRGIELNYEYRMLDATVGMMKVPGRTRMILIIKVSPCASLLPSFPN